MLGVIAIKIWVIFVYVWVHGVHYQWGIDDVRFILKQGALMAFVMCSFVTIFLIKNRR
jgi:hypothetical protein